MTKKQRYKVHKIVVSVLFLKLIKLTKYIPNAIIGIVKADKSPKTPIEIKIKDFLKDMLLL
jgi:hypothetical protein